MDLNRVLHQWGSTYSPSQYGAWMLQVFRKSPGAEKWSCTRSSWSTICWCTVPWMCMSVSVCKRHCVSVCVNYSLSEWFACLHAGCCSMWSLQCLHGCWIGKKTVDTPVNVACAFAHAAHGGCVCVHVRGQLALTASRSSGQVQLSLCMWRGESVTCL